MCFATLHVVLDPAVSVEVVPSSILSYTKCVFCAFRRNTVHACSALELERGPDLRSAILISVSLVRTNKGCTRACEV